VLAKDEAQKERLGTVLYNLLEVIRRGAVMLLPLLPETAIEILRELNAEKEIAAIEASDKESLEFSEFIGEFGGMVAGSMVGDSKVLFARVDEAKKLAELEEERLAAMKAAAPAEEERPEKPEGLALIGIEDFMKVELRVAKITACERVPKAKKLLKLQVDLGYEQRQIVSGIAKFYEPEAIIGKKVIVVANLKPATLCGIESQGMLLAASSEAADSPIRVVFLSDDTPMGDRVR
jgi:methionyl-tRNA synthetase